jgi:flagellar motor switch protein FliN/FliY
VGGADKTERRLEMLLDVPLELTVELGRASLQIEEILRLGPGSVVALDRLEGEPLDIKLNGRIVARGEAVVVDGRLGVRIAEVAGEGARDELAARLRPAGQGRGRAG